MTSIRRDEIAHEDRLRVLMVIHYMRMGGSQKTAVDLACGMFARGHDVTVAAPRGVLTQIVHEAGVPYIPLEDDEPGKAVSRAIPGFRRLLDVTRDVKPDIVHTLELTPSILTYLGAHRLDGTPMTMTINSMSVPDFMPGSVPLQVCTPLIATETRRRSGPLGVLEIPTDTTTQYPGYPGGPEFRRQHGIADDELMVVIVSRFAKALKQEGLETAMRAAGRLAPTTKIKLVLVGDGPAMPDLRRLAATTNAAAGREVVVLTGEMLDPRPAYAAADVAVGMAGSLLRAMAFGKPCIVQGEHGYFELLDPETAPAFRWRTFYGIGDGGTGEEKLVELLGRMLRNHDERERNARFALALVRKHYSLDDAVTQQIDWYREILAQPVPKPEPREMAKTVGAMGAWFGKRAVTRPEGKEKSDYFNSSERIAPGIRGKVPTWFNPDLPTAAELEALPELPARTRQTNGAGIAG